MPIMVIVGNGKRTTVDITGWSQREIDGACLAVQVDGYRVAIGVGR